MDITTRHRKALDDWSHAQHLSQCVPVAHRPVVGPMAALIARIPVFGSAIRSLQRIRYLGALSQRQLALNQVDFEEAQFHGHFATSANEVLATLQREMAQVLVYQRTMGPPAALRTQMADIAARQAALEERLLGLHETILQSDARHNTLESQLSLAAARIEADLSRITGELGDEMQRAILELRNEVQQKATTTSVAIDKLADQLQEEAQQTASVVNSLAGQLREEIHQTAQRAATAEEELAALEQTIRMQSGQLRLLRHELQVSAPLGLEGEDAAVQHDNILPTLIGILEDGMPQLREAGDIGLAIHGPHMENALFALVTYFGDRLARTPDAIVSSRVHYHIDFSSSWNCEEVYAGAARKLIPGGYFVIITGSDDETAPEPEGFIPVADRVLSVGSATARASIWRREGPGASEHREEAPDRATV